MPTIETINAKIGADVSDLKRGMGEAKATLQQFSQTVKSEGEKMTLSARQFMAGLENETKATLKNVEVKRQQLTFERELRASKSELTAVLARESAAAQNAALKYDLLSQAQRQQLVRVQEQITANKALQQAEAETALAAERAAEKEAAAAVSAAKAAEAAAARKLATARKNLGRNVETVGGALTSGVSLPIVAFGAAAIASGADVQNAENRIRTMTGASGEHLKALDEAFKKVAADVPQSFGEVATVVSELAIRTGLTGTALQALATQELNLARITHSDVGDTVQKTTQLFAAWGISTKDQGRALDLLFRAVEASGGKFTDLTGGLVRFAPALKTLGFSLTDSAALLSAFDKAGIPPQRMMQALTTALSRLAKVGITDAHQALEVIIQQMQHAKTPMDALSAAGHLFGVKMGVDVVQAMRSGKFNLEQLEQAIGKGKDTVNKAAANVDTFATTWGKLKHQAELALASMGGMLLKVGIDILKALKPALEMLDRLAEAFSKLPEGTQKAIIGVLAFAAVVGPVVVGIGQIIAAVTELRAAWAGIALIMEGSAGVTAITEGLGAIGAAVAGLSLGWVAAIGAMATVTVLFLTNFHGWRDDFVSGLHVIGGTISAMAHGLKPANAYAQAKFEEQRRLYGPLPAGSASYSGGGGDLGDFTPKYSDVAPPPPKPKLPDYTGALQKYQDMLAKVHEAEAGKGKKQGAEKLTPLQREQKEYADQLEQAHARLTEVLAGEDNIAAQVAGKYHLMHLNGHDALTTTLQQIKAHENHANALKAVRQEIERLNTDTRQVLNYDPAGKFFATHPGLSDSEKQKFGAQINAAESYNKKVHEAADQAKQDALDEKNAVKSVKDQIDSLSRSLLAAGAAAKFGPINRESLALLSEFHESYATLTDGQKKLIDALYKLKLQEQATDQQGEVTKKLLDQEATGWQKIASRMAEASKKNMELRGTNAETAQSVQELFSNIDILDNDMYLWALSVVDADNANEKLAKSIEKAKDEGKGMQDGLVHLFQQINDHSKLMKDLDRQYQLLTHGSLKDQIALNSEYATTYAKLPPAIQKWVDEQVKATQKVRNETTKLDLWKQFGEGFERTFQTAFMNLNQGFKGFFGSIVQGFEQMLQQMAAQYLASQIANLFLGSPDENGNRSGGLLGGLLGHLFGARAMGGPVTQDTPYLVGEQGPELFLPRRSGHILSTPQTAGALAGGGSINIQMTVHAADANSFNRSQGQIMADLHRNISQAMKRTGRGG